MTTIAILLAVLAFVCLASLLGAFSICRAARDEDMRVYYEDLGRASRRGSDSSDRVQP